MGNMPFWISLSELRLLKRSGLRLKGMMRGVTGEEFTPYLRLRHTHVFGW
jgi:hypothetical protein